MSVKRKVYIAGPSADLFKTEPGESRIEKILAEAAESGLEVPFDWPANIRRFFATEHASEADRNLDYDQSMRKCYTGIVEADVVCFVLIDGAPSEGMIMEAGLATFLGKEVILLHDDNFSVEQAKFSSHPFFRLSPLRRLHLSTWFKYI